MTRYIHPGKGCFSPLYSTVSLICDGMHVLLFEILVCMPLKSQCLCIAVTFVILCIYLLFVWPLVFTRVLLTSLVSCTVWCCIVVLLCFSPSVRRFTFVFYVSNFTFIILILSNTNPEGFYSNFILFLSAHIFTVLKIWFNSYYKAQILYRVMLLQILKIHNNYPLH